MIFFNLFILTSLVLGSEFEVANSPKQDLKEIFSDKRLREFIAYPSIVKDYSISGISIVEFDVRNSGDIDNIKIIKSMGDPFDNEIFIGLKKFNSKNYIKNDFSEKFKYRLPIYFKN